MESCSFSRPHIETRWMRGKEWNDVCGGVSMLYLNVSGVQGQTWAGDNLSAKALFSLAMTLDATSVSGHLKEEHTTTPLPATHTLPCTTWMSTWQVFLSLNVFGRVSAHQGQVMTHFNSCLPYLATYPSDTFSFPHSPLPFGVAQYVFLLLWVDSYFGEI